MSKHEHTKMAPSCAHEHLKFCANCDVVECAACGKEWKTPDPLATLPAICFRPHRDEPFRWEGPWLGIPGHVYRTVTTPNTLSPFSGTATDPTDC